MAPRNNQTSTNQDLRTEIAVLKNDIKYLTDKVDEISSKLDYKYVTQDEFDPIKKIVYGLVALILTAVIGAVVSLVLNRS
jgi:hypothetical protein